MKKAASAISLTDAIKNSGGPVNLSPAFRVALRRTAQHGLRSDGAPASDFARLSYFTPAAAGAVSTDGG